MDTLAQKLSEITTEEELANMDVADLTQQDVVEAIFSTLYGKLDYSPSKKLAIVRYTDVQRRAVEVSTLMSAVGFLYHELERYNPDGVDKEPIRDFLNAMFKFNPDLHVQSLEQMAKDKDEKFENTDAEGNIPVNHFFNFSEFNRQRKEHYDGLTEKFFGLPNYSQLAINVLEVVDNERDAHKFLEKHREKLIKASCTNVAAIPLNSWVDLATATNNVTILNKDNPIKSILDQMEKDRKIADALVEKRVEKLKVVEAKTVGTSNLPKNLVTSVPVGEREFKDLESKTVDPFLPKYTPVTETPQVQTESETVDLPKGVVEVPVHTFDASTKSYKKSKFYSDLREESEDE